MPTREIWARFWQDYDRLTLAQQQRFRRAAQRFAQDVDTGSIRASLRVKPLVNHRGIWELTWEGSDGRATFSYGPEQVPGKRHIVWRRIGGHEIFQEP